jgi:predicted nucleotidyltransferase
MFSSGEECVGELSDRRSQTAARIKILREKLSAADGIAAGKACVYATGSFGRCEASVYSDLDLFIVSKMGNEKAPDGKQQSLLKRLDDIRIKADLIEVTRELRIPEFSGDGKYLVHYSVQELTGTLGKPEDDALNTFTARLLLLLESAPLLGASVYKDVIEEVIAPYWKDFADHKGDFVPAFLTNDILRLWRTFCVNYEANTSSEPTAENVKRKSKNYKLKHSRLLTCYSALLYLLAVYGRQNTVSPDDVVHMTQLTPTLRLEWLLDQRDIAGAHAAVRKLLDQYDAFLQTTNILEKDLIEKFKDKATSRTYMASANTFGQSMFEALTSIGDGSRLHRLLIV